jgi:hypothetical protein
MAYAYAVKGDTAGVGWAVEESVKRRAGNRVVMNVLLAILTHDSAAFASLRQQVLTNVDQSALDVAMGYTFNRNADSILVRLDRAYASKSDVLGFVQYPVFDWLRNDPRFVALRKKYNIPDVKR